MMNGLIILMPMKTNASITGRELLKPGYLLKSINDILNFVTVYSPSVTLNYPKSIYIFIY